MVELPVSDRPVTEPPLRVGVIGAGVWAQVSHIPRLVARGDVELVGVCRKGAAELVELAARFGFTVASEDYRDVLAAGLDVVVVSSPAALHFEHALAALEAGAHVLVEKPLTISAEHARQLHRRADELGRHVVVAFGWNYLPTYVAAAELWADGGVGRIEHVMMHMGSGTRQLLQGSLLKSATVDDPSAEAPTWTDPAVSGGGYAQAQLSHLLAWGLGITGLRAETVYALGYRPPGAAVEIHDALAVRFAGGATAAVSGASFHSGSQDNRHQYEIRVFGDEGQLHADLERDRLWLWRHDSGPREIALPPAAGAYHCDGPVDAIVDLARGRAVVNRSPLELGVRTVELLAAAYESMATGAVAHVAP